MAIDPDDLPDPTKMNLSPELLKEYLALIKEVRANIDAQREALQGLDLFEKMRVERAQELLTSLSSINDLKKEAREHQEEINRLTNNGAIAVKDLGPLVKKQVEYREQEIKRLTEVNVLLTGANDLQRVKQTLQAEELKTALASLTIAERQRVAEEQIYKLRSKGAGETEKLQPSIWENFKNSISALPPALKDMGEELSQAGLETAALSLLIPDLGLDKIQRDVRQLPGILDDEYRSIIKSGVMHTEKLHEAYIAVMDPVQAASKEFGQIADKDMQLFLTNVGILPKEAAAAMKVAKDQISLFRESFITANKENYTMVGATTQLIASLKKMGVAESDTAATVDTFNRALKESPRQAHESVRRLTNIAHSLDVNVAEVFKQFGATVGELSQYGDSTVEVFADLQAQSVATGLDVGKLSGIASGLDTFKGAAVAAQGFNAVLGKTVLSVTDLVHAEPAEKIELLKEAMDRSGTSFETANRRVKSMIASMIGASSVADAARIFGSSEDYFKLHEEMDTTVEDMDDLKKRVEDTMTVGERASKMQSSLVAGSQKLIEEAYSSADKMSNLLIGTYARVREETNDTKEAVLSMLTLLTAAGSKVQAAKGIGGTVLRVGSTILTLEALAKELGFGGVTEDAVKFIEPILNKDLDGDGKVGALAPGADRDKGMERVLAAADAIKKRQAGAPAGGTATAAAGINITIPVKVVSANGVLLAETTVNQYIERFQQRTAAGAPTPKSVGG